MLKINALHWFRADLRVTDNKALQTAMKEATQLTSVFIFTPDTWRKHHCSPRKMQLILDSLESLARHLAKQGVSLIIRQCATYMDSVPALLQLCDELDVSHLYFNKQYELDEQKRDEIVTESLSTIDVFCHKFDDQTIVPPGKICNLSGDQYKVFTPFKKTWLKEVVASICQYEPTACSNKKFKFAEKDISDELPKKITHFTRFNLSDDHIACEVMARKMLTIFCEEKVACYHEQRDFPSLTSTSQLSAALSIGTLSARQCLKEIIKLTQGDLLNTLQYPGELTWLSELIWRDFYKHILFRHPRLCRHKPYKESTDHLPWKTDEKLLLAWQKGKTGFPLVDAAMRQLNQTGWMHNRLRMVTAMFFTKTLFLDWRLGEKYFMKNLIDGDFSANNGGWQWCASTGTDAVPYFRIFNPTTQSERFDKEGIFIRQYCPELQGISNKKIHDPYTRGVKVGEINYPEPIVNYKEMREYVIEQFKKTQTGDNY
jgi:deoxyribodipyrimidine photo-lyase